MKNDEIANGLLDILKSARALSEEDQNTLARLFWKALEEEKARKGIRFVDPDPPGCEIVMVNGTVGEGEDRQMGLARAHGALGGLGSWVADDVVERVRKVLDELEELDELEGLEELEEPPKVIVTGYGCLRLEFVRGREIVAFEFAPDGVVTQSRTYTREVAQEDVPYLVCKFFKENI